MSSDNTPKFVILCVMDGWGIAPPGPGNAISLSNKINFDKYNVSYPNSQLEAAGTAVGLPRGEDGNTETGHINLGAGRIVYQDLERINMSIADGTFFQNKAILDAINHSKKFKSKLHLMGLIGAGGVHSNINHLMAIIRMVKQNGFDDLYIHAFTDGRDSPQTSGKMYLIKLNDYMNKIGVGKIASVTGRYWAMDRDQRWDRTEKAYNALVSGDGKITVDCIKELDNYYSNGITDEFIEPILVKDSKNHLNTIKDNDSVIFFNFRIDRPRQLTKAFIFKDLIKASLIFDSDPYKKNVPQKINKAPFNRKVFLKNLHFLTMTDYGKSITEEGGKIAFPPEVVQAPLSSVISNNGYRQLKITESEKERFVTFYFNGLRESPYPMEEKVIIQSLKVPTYDQAPEMKSIEITETVIKKIQNNDFKFIVINYPNPDMVGHTGNIGPTVKAIEAVDTGIGKLGNFCLAYGGALILTADHGNAEEMINIETKEIDTEHSSNRVPFICIFKPFLGKSHTLKSGILADVAPTILNLLKIAPPSSMTGRNLLSDVDY